jgi:hypothetical protein
MLWIEPVLKLFAQGSSWDWRRERVAMLSYNKPFVVIGWLWDLFGVIIWPLDRDYIARKAKLTGFYKHLLTIGITVFLDFVHCPKFEILENTTFRKLNLFPASDEGRKTHTLLHPLESANLNNWNFLRDQKNKCFPPLNWRRKHPVFETLCFLLFRLPDDGRSPETQ